MPYKFCKAKCQLGYLCCFFCRDVCNTPCGYYL